MGPLWSKVSVLLLFAGFWVTGLMQKQWSANKKGRAAETECSDVIYIIWMQSYEHEGQFHLINMFSFPLAFNCTSIYIYLCIKARLKFIKVLGHVCVGFIDPRFERGVALWSHWARKWWASLREREGWQTLWCAEIDNIKGSQTKTHFLATAQALSCVTGWYDYLDEREADGCRARCLYPRMIWDMILENVGLQCIRGQHDSGSQWFF